MRRFTCKLLKLLKLGYQAGCQYTIPSLHMYMLTFSIKGSSCMPSIVASSAIIKQDDCLGTNATRMT